MLAGKTCPWCGEFRSIDEFPEIRRRGVMCRRAHCIECERNRKRRWYEANRERAIEKARAWSVANPGRRRSIRVNYYARSRGASAYTPVDFLEIASRDGWRCYLCGEQIDPADVALDHVVPLSRGGEHSMDNVRLVHSLCNARKGTKTAEELSA